MRVVLSVLLVLSACAPAGLRVDPAQVSGPTPLAASDRSCVAALDSLQAIIRRDYAGYRDKVRGHEAALATLSDSVRAMAHTSDHYSVCIPALRRWVQFFRDPHMLVWQAAPPAPAGSTRPPATEPTHIPAEDPGRPSLRWVDDSTAVLRLPTLDMRYKPAIDSLVTASRAKLLATPYLIVDVRGNDGGCTCSYQSVRPLLYTGPIRLVGMEAWASEGNVAFFRGWLTDAAVPEEVKAQVRTILPQMEAQPNQFVRWPGETEIRLDTVYSMPRKVAVLVDRGCASSCEDFVLEARQSQKVTVLGTENTAGALDYGNVRSVWLPGWRRLRVPTSRSRWLPDNPIDNVGVAPEVRIPEGESDAVEFARHLLRSDG